MATLDLPPYGYTMADNADFLATRPVPKGFRRRPGTTGPTSGPDDWEAWLQALAQEFATLLWPLWDEGTGWQGAATATAEALTVADLALMRDIQSVEAQQPIVGRRGTKTPQLVAFREEDEKAPGPTFEYYESDLPVALKQAFFSNIMVGGRDIALPVSQGLKSRIQRPRPWQVGLLWHQLPPLRVQRSATAITPSMISGHCVQGSLALAQVLAAIGNDLRAIPGLEEDVCRYLLDTGDRRVFAGLHYPSDNISSWYSALSLCDHVFDGNGPDIRNRLWQAVQNTAVFQAILKRGAHAAYGPILTRLESRATRGSQDTGGW